MKKIIIILFLFIASFSYAQIAPFKGIILAELTTTELNALSSRFKKEGSFYYDTTLNKFVTWNGSSFEVISGSGSASNAVTVNTASTTQQLLLADGDGSNLAAVTAANPVGAKTFYFDFESLGSATDGFLDDVNLSYSNDTLTAVFDMISPLPTITRRVRIPQSGEISKIFIDGNNSARFINDIIIPDGVVSIRSNGFTSKGITSVSLPTSIDSIYLRAFNSNAIENLVINQGCLFIGNQAFQGNALTSLTIPNSVTSIGINAFSNNLLTSVTIPSSVTSLDSGAFATNLLTTVTIPSSITSIANVLFQNNSLTSITIPSSVTSIGTSSFFNNLLPSITIPSSVTSIGNGAFAGNLLTSVTIPSSVTSIGATAFANNTLLTSVTIPSSVTSIGTQAFFGTAITSVSLPTGITLGTNAFPVGTTITYY